MVLSLFGRKIGMMQLFKENGSISPATIIKITPNQVSQIKTIKTDNYNAVQIAYDRVSTSSCIKKPQLGHLKKSSDLIFNSFGEFHTPNPQEFKIGQSLTVNEFSLGHFVQVSGKSSGKGFSGNQKRHRFSRGPMTHGSKNHRLPGSIGAGSTPGRVYPGKKMAGRLGGKKVTIKTSEVLCINKKEDLLILSGSLPGKRNSILKIQWKTKV